MELKIGDFVKILGKSVTLEGVVYDDPVGILLHKWDENLWKVLIFNKTSTIHSVRIQLLIS
jgi:hypothetical protein